MLVKIATHYAETLTTQTIGQRVMHDLRMDVFMISLVYGWHPLVEGSKRLKSE